MIIRKYNKGYYVCRIPPGSSGGVGKRGQRIYRNWFLVKPKYKKGYVQIGNINFPKAFIGKKIRLKCEVCLPKFS